ncbi:MAG: ABC transporter permease [Lachnospiraceae bacterium]|nr:ABC transporter permease [Lachnospiraceae bacterium]
MRSLKRTLSVIVSRKASLIGLVIVILFILTAIFAPLIMPYSPTKAEPANKLADPSMQHLLGTDHMGRDILSRIISGSRITLEIAIVSVLIAGLIGCILGLTAGYFGGAVDSVIMRITDAMTCIPKMALAMALTFALGRGTFSLMMAIGLSSIPGYVRLIRGQVLSIRNYDYIQAQTIIGTKKIKVLLSEILPNCISPLIVYATTNLGASIITESSLSFIGCGVQAPNAAWGSMVEDGFSLIRVYPYLSIFPGVAILIVVLAFNMLGDGLRDALDPRISKSL